MKRILPSLGALTAFETAARHASFTRAGEELGLTQSAVSRQVAQLETMLKVKLFERVRRQIVLTPDGQTYARQIGAALDRAQAATLELIASKSSTAGVLHISSLGTLASHWIAPRILSFATAYPDLAFEMSTYDQPSGFSSHEVDVAIYQGEPSWPGGILEWLMNEELIPLCSPSYLKQIRSRSSFNWQAITLLQHKSRPETWADLISEFNIKGINPLKGPRFSSYAMIIEAALSGLGVGAIPNFLAEGHIESGRLVRVFEGSIVGRYSYYLVYPEAKKQLPKIKAFRSWIIKEAKPYRVRKARPTKRPGE